jgi:WD40 repeat protein
MFRTTHLIALALPFVTPFQPVLCGQSVQITYDDHVKPILQQHCSTCHGPNRKENDLDVTSYPALMQGGGSGEVIAPGSIDESYLYQLVAHLESPEMPPSGKIPDAEIKLLADWISGGALENQGSKPKPMKPKPDLALNGDALTRPDKVVVPLRISIDPPVRTPRGTVHAIATSPWAKVAAISAPRQVLLYSTESLELLGILPFEEGVAHQLRFSRSGSVLLGAGGKDGKLGTAILWNVATGERIAQLGSELDVILAADIAPKHDLVAIGGPSKLVKVLNAADGSVRFEIKKHNDWVTAIEFSPDGKLLATGDRNGALHVWETSSGAELYALGGHSAAISGLTFRPDSKVLASASEDTTVRTWEMEKGTALKSWGAHGRGVTAIQFLRDGNLATGGRDNLCKVWNQDGGVIRQSSTLGDVIVSMAYCNETNRLLGADWAGQIAVWNPDGQEAGRLLANPPTLAERLATANEALANAMNRLAPAESELQVATRKMEDLKASLATKQNERNQVDARLTEAKNLLAPTQQKITALTEQHQAYVTELQQTKTNLPLVAEALEKIAAASAAMTNDQELAQSKSQVEAKKQSLEVRMTELDALIPQLAKELTDLQTKLVEVEKMVAVETELLANDDKMLAELMAQVTPLEQDLAQKATTYQTVAAEVSTAKSQVQKWQGEGEFIAQMAALDGKLKATAQTIEQKQSIEEELKTKLRDLERQLNQAHENTQASEREAEGIRQEMLILRGGGSQ